MADLSDIIDTLIAEAYGEGPEGMRRVGETILNRAAIRRLDPAEVVRQPSQYTGYFAPGPAAIQAQQDPIARSAAEAAWELARQPGDPTDGADHYKANYVNPGWAAQMPQTGSYGAHDFYRSTAVPAEALARLLAPTAPTPFAPPARGNVPSDLISRSFANNSAAQARSSVADLFGPAVNSNTPRLTSAGAVANPSAMSTDWARNIFPGTGRRAAPIIAAQDLTRAGAVDGVHAALAQDNSLQDALRQKINSQGTTVASFPTAPPARPPTPMPTGVAQSYAGQESITPSTARAVANLLMPQRPQTYAGQEAQRRDPFNGDPGTPASGPVVASIPTTTSGVGNPPATRRVASVPVSPRDPVQSMPAFSEIASVFGRPSPAPTATAAIKKQFGPAVPGPNGYSSDSKDQSRLSPTLGAFAATPGPALFGGLDPNLASPAPIPRSASDAARARAPKPTTRTVTERVTNPAWTEAQRAAKIDPVDSMPSWGDFASTFAPKPAAKMPSQYINVTRQVPVAAPKVAPAPFIRPASFASQQPQRAPLRITVNGGNVQQPQSLYHSDPVAFGQQSVNQSGDTSSGSQLEAAQARASGEGGRNRRY